MDNLIICKENGNRIISLSLETYKVNFSEIKDREVYLGTHSIKAYKDNLLVANSFSNNIVILNRETLEEEDIIYVGAHPKDLICFENKVYVICAESNSLQIIDLKEKNIIGQVECGDYPHSIIMDDLKKKVIVCNMYNNEINIIDMKSMIKEKSFKVGTYPTRIITKGNKLIVCESYIGEKENGSISLYDLDTGNRECVTRVGKAPVDMCYANGYYYISNMCDGSISILDKQINKISEIIIGGMPQKILYNKEKLYVLDSCNNKLSIVSLEDKTKKIIAIGKEPTTMILQYSH